MTQSDDPPSAIARRSLLQAAGGLIAATLADAETFAAPAAAALERHEIFSPDHAAIVSSIATRIWPGADEAGAVTYIDHALAGIYAGANALYHAGLPLLDAAAQRKFGTPFAKADGSKQDAVLRDLELGQLSELPGMSGIALFEMLRRHVMEGVLSDPIYGGNRDFAGWKAVGYPGPYRLSTEQDQIATTPLDTPSQSLKDL
jgi:gluconate 2-dehydrogenase gamma chain